MSFKQEVCVNSASHSSERVGSTALQNQKMTTMKIWYLIIYIYIIMLLVGRDSECGTATHYTLNSLEFKSQWGCGYL